MSSTDSGTSSWAVPWPEPRRRLIPRLPGLEPEQPCRWPYSRGASHWHARGGSGGTLTVSTAGFRSSSVRGAACRSPLSPVLRRETGTGSRNGWHTRRLAGIWPIAWATVAIPRTAAAIAAATATPAPGVSARSPTPPCPAPHAPHAVPRRTRRPQSRADPRRSHRSHRSHREADDLHGRVGSPDLSYLVGPRARG